MFFWIRFVASPRAQDGAPAPPSSLRGSACPESVAGCPVGRNRRNKKKTPVDDDDDEDELGLPDQDDGDGAMVVGDLLLRRILR